MGRRKRTCPDVNNVEASRFSCEGMITVDGWVLMDIGQVLDQSATFQFGLSSGIKLINEN